MVINPGNYLRKAVQLRTTGWGRGCYSKTGGDYVGKPGVVGKCEEGSPEIGSRVRNVSAGIIYLGNYSFTTPSQATEDWWHWHKIWGTIIETETYKTHTYYAYDAFVAEERAEGAAFASRPSTLSFQYTFTPVSGTTGFYVRAALYAADGTQIGEATCTDAAQQDNMSTRTLTFNYTDLDKPAVKLCLLFSSDADLSVRTSGSTEIPSSPLVVKQTNGDPHVGNVLLIDNVQLGYDFE